MRVVGGKWKSRKINQLLKNDHYSIIRPTTDRIRENIFNIIQNLDVKDQIEGANVLDIFCGTGAMGIEALSRGASFCQFIDNSPISSQITLNNIKNLRCENETNFLLTNVLEIGGYGLKKGDVVFMDPPYKKRISEVVIQRLLQKSVRLRQFNHHSASCCALIPKSIFPTSIKKKNENTFSRHLSLIHI